MADLDVELATALKQAKTREMYFAFIPAGQLGTLLVSKKKIPPKEIAQARKESGGGKPLIGRCMGPVSDMVFKVAKAASPALAAAIKRVAKQDAGVLIVPTFELASDVDEGDEEEGTETGAPRDAATPPKAPPTPAGQPQTPTKQTGAPDFGPWQAACQDAIADLKALASKVVGLKHETSGEVAKELFSIIALLKKNSNPAPNDIDKLEALIDHEAISVAEQCPAEFHKINIRQPLLDALEALRK